MSCLQGNQFWMDITSEVEIFEFISTYALDAAQMGLCREDLLDLSMSRDENAASQLADDFSSD